MCKLKIIHIDEMIEKFGKEDNALYKLFVQTRK